MVFHNGGESRHRQKVRAALPDCLHVEVNENGGYAGGATRALDAAFQRGVEWVFFVTNDCVVTGIGQIPHAPCLLAPAIGFASGRGMDSLGGRFIPWRARLEHCKNAVQFDPRSRLYAPGSAFVLHRDVWQSARPFDLSLGMFWEDVDFAQRVQSQGFALRLGEDWKLAHKGGKSTRKDPHYTLYLYQRNRKRVSWRYSGAWQRVLLAGVLGASWARQFFRLLRHGRFADMPRLWHAILD